MQRVLNKLKSVLSLRLTLLLRWVFLHPWRFAVLLIVLFFSLRFLVWHFYFPAYTPKVMTTISTQITTHCIGRYLVELPSDMDTVHVTYSQLYYGLDSNFRTVDINVKHGDYDITKFVEEVNARYAELQTKTNTELKIPLMLKAERFDTPVGKAILIRYLANEDYSSSQVRSELHQLVGNRYVIMQANSFYPDVSKTLPDGYAEYKDINPQPAEDRLKRIAMNIKSYSASNKVGEGFCINGVVLNDKTMGYDEEKVSVAFRHTTGNITLAMDFVGKTGKGRQTLFERLDKRARDAAVYFATSNPNNFRFHTLRRRELEIEGMKFQEWMEETEEDDVRKWSFRLENLHNPKSSLIKPGMEFHMYGDESFGLEQVTPVWDAMLKTLRLSPANGGLAR